MKNENDIDHENQNHEAEGKNVGEIFRHEKFMSSGLMFNHVAAN